MTQSSIVKIEALFKYLRSLAALKVKPIRNYKNQEWVFDPKSIPYDLPGVTISFRDSYENASIDDSPLLKVAKPEFSACPEPAEELKPWLKEGWDSYKNNAVVKEWRIGEDPETGEPIKILFADDTKLSTLLSSWLEKRIPWAESQNKVEQTRNLFVDLYNIHTDLTRDSETLELMVGNGFIKDRRDSEINHPLLLKKVRLLFNPDENTISITDLDSSPELYSMLIRDMLDLNLDCIQAIGAELEKEEYHPFDRIQASQFLERLAHLLTPKSEFSETPSDSFSSHDTRILIYLKSVFFVRKKIDGTAKAIDSILDCIENGVDIPSYLIDLVEGGVTDIVDVGKEESIEEKLAAVGGEDPDILFAKEANREQLEIARRIEKHHAVLVQGPPGTGKTHTIANLLGHFLSQGKSILVTSQTKKALNVLKEKLPPEMQGLCVSVLDDTNEDMERSVDAISEYSGAHTSGELQREVVKAEEERRNVIEALAETRAQIFAVLHQENASFVLGGSSVTPIEAAKFVAENKDDLESIIPKPIDFNCVLPLSRKEIEELYQTNDSITSEECAELDAGLPDLQNILDAQTYEKTLERIKRDNERIENACISGSLEIASFSDFKTLGIILPQGQISISLENNAAIDELLAFVAGYTGTEEWRIRAAADGKRGAGYRSRWDRLFQQIRKTYELSQSLVADSLGKKIIVQDGYSVSTLRQDIQKMSDTFERKGKIGKLDRVLNGNFKVIEDVITVNDSPLQNAKDCQYILKMADLEDQREKCRSYWADLMSNHGAPLFDDLDSREPERIAFNWIERIESFLDWYAKKRTHLIKLMSEAHITPINTVLQESDLDSEENDILRTLEAMEKTIPLICEIAKVKIDSIQAEAKISSMRKALLDSRGIEFPTCRNLLNAIDSRNIEKYVNALASFQSLHNKKETKRKRDDLLDRIARHAPNWSKSIQGKEGIHGKGIPPARIADAWIYEQYVMYLDKLNETPLSELQNSAFALSSKYRTCTAKLAEKKAWLALLERTETSITLKQALNGWKLAMKRIGKGTGKRAAQMKARAREQMSECQQAVPAWIMPMGKALDTLDPSSNRFDIIIIDEASQSDVSALALTFMGKKVIFVGDDKQVSPMAIGIEDAKVASLNNMYIKDIIPNDYLYGPTTSLYDIASTTFQPLMLREHFRCVPQIIGYSNMLSYDFKIKPLREPGSSNLLPAVISHRVKNGMRQGKSKTNRAEAEEIVALIMSCIKQPEYADKTFGIISLLGGGAQVKTIQQVLFSKMDLREIEKRKILVGEPASFQGDERDVIFLSLVDGNDGEGPLRLMGNGVENSMKKRYNVAASRAKDQLWVVHSLDAANDLKENDLRKTLIQYAENPEAFAQKIKAVELLAESPFEEAVGKALVAKGYRIAQQWEVGSYRLDIVVVGSQSRVAIECDGEMWHSGDEKIREDMERQTILERIGWRFIRIRGSEYYRNPNETMDCVFNQLESLGIDPLGNKADHTYHQKSDLLERVLARLEEFLEKPDDGKLESGDRVEITPPNVELLYAETAIKETTVPAREAANNGADPKKSADEQTKKHKNGKATPLQIGLFDPEENSTSQHDFTVKPNVAAKSKDTATTKLSQTPEICPKEQPIDQITRKIRSYGLKEIDKRNSNGKLWIIGDYTKAGTVRNIAREFDVRFEYAKNGGRATGNEPAWYMVGQPVEKPEGRPLHASPVNGKLPDRQPQNRATRSCTKTAYKVAGPKIRMEIAIKITSHKYISRELTPIDIRDASLYTNSRYYGEIQHRMDAIIETEAPIEKQRLFNTVRGSMGVKRSGAEIQAHNEWILTKLDHKTTRFGEREFIWRTDQNPESYFTYRKNEEDAERKFDEIPCEELIAAAMDALSKTLTSRKDGLIERMKLCFGLKRTTDNLRSTFGTAIDEGVNRNLILLDDKGYYSVPRKKRQ